MHETHFEEPWGHSTLSECVQRLEHTWVPSPALPLKKEKEKTAYFKFKRKKKGWKGKLFPMYAYLSESLHLSQCLCKTALCLVSRIPVDWAVSEVSGAGHMIVFYPQMKPLGVLPSEDHLLGAALSPSLGKHSTASQNKKPFVRKFPYRVVRKPWSPSLSWQTKSWMLAHGMA